MVSVNSRQQCLRIFQSLLALYEKYQISIASDVVSVTPDPHFQVLVANFSKKPYLLAKPQAIGSMTPHPLKTLPTQVRATKVLGITNQDVGK